jgi:hypothetical protein
MTKTFNSNNNTFNDISNMQWCGMYQDIHWNPSRTGHFSPMKVCTQGNTTERNRCTVHRQIKTHMRFVKSIIIWGHEPHFTLWHIYFLQSGRCQSIAPFIILVFKLIWTTTVQSTNTEGYFKKCQLIQNWTNSNSFWPTTVMLPTHLTILCYFLNTLVYYLISSNQNMNEIQIFQNNI